MQLLSPLESQLTVTEGAAQTGCSYCWLVERERECAGEREKVEKGRMNQNEQAITVSWCDSTQEAVYAAPGTVTITLGKEERVVGGRIGTQGCIVNKPCVRN